MAPNTWKKPHPDSLFSLDGECAVVTGALGKLGAIWVEALLEAGAVVFAIDLPDTEPSSAFGALQSRFGASRMQLARADVTDCPAFAAGSRQCLKVFGTPSVLVNNAGA